MRGKCLAEYVFLGGSGGDLRSRTRVLDHVPATAADCPLWTVDTWSSTDQVRGVSPALTAQAGPLPSYSGSETLFSRI